MSNIQKYSVLNASNEVSDRLDADNFYPYDGLGEIYEEDEVFGNFMGLDTDGEGLDIEFSDAIGDFFKNIGSKLGNFKSKKGERVLKRTNRRTERKERRQKRRDERQASFIQNISQQVKGFVAKIAERNPVVTEPIKKMTEGIATPKQEEIVEEVVRQAEKMVNENITEPPVIEVDAKGNVEVKDSWWSKQKTGIKVAIIGGGALVLGLGVWAITKKGKSKGK